MTEELLPPQALALMRPEAITPAVEFLLSGTRRPAPSWCRRGFVRVIKIVETEGINLAQSDWTPGRHRCALRCHRRHVDRQGVARRVRADAKNVAQAAARAGIKL